MATLLLLDRAQYFQGMVSVFRGDAWAIDAQVVDQIGGVRLPKDLTGKSVTAYFPSATGGDNIAAVAELTNALAGSIRIPVTDDVTPLVEENTGGIQLFVVVDGVAASGNPYTAQITDPDLAVIDRQFQQFT
jgi:hypothetical protein